MTYGIALRSTLVLIAALVVFDAMPAAVAQEPPRSESGAIGGDYTLGAGDIVRITVFQNPDLTTEVRVSESGSITFPLIGNIAVGGLSLPEAEGRIAARLREGGFVLQPQVSMLPLQVRGNQVAVLGQVNRPGRYPLETFNTRVSGMLATAGGIAETGADVVVLTRVRDGAVTRKLIDVHKLFANGEQTDDALAGGDILYVDRAPMFFIYGEVQRPGAFRLEREMSVMQALATGGGLTLRGTERGLRVHRRGTDGSLQVLKPALDDLLQPNDVVYVRESLF